MGWHIVLVFSVLFLTLVQNTHSQDNVDADIARICRAAQSDCMECILAHPECTWCADRIGNAERGFRRIRCKTERENNATCNREQIQNPRNDITFPKDMNFTKREDVDLTDSSQQVIQLRPQESSLKLRKGQPQKVNVTFQRVFDYPLDLYFVMDLSNSMGDDLQRLKDFGDALVEDIVSITGNVRLGFGTFVDKVVMPFASTVPAQLKNPCINTATANTTSGTCAPVFGFRHQLPITSDGSLFRQAVADTEISGNIDSPEGGLDALMQIAVCQDKIKWRSDSLRVILYTSDATPHLAMDGKLAAILEKNDMHCHLAEGINPNLPDAVVYSKSKVMDYPSLGQLNYVFNKNKIQTIFAVTDDVYPLYENLRSVIDNANVQILARDSGNIISVIRGSYSTLSSRIQLNSQIETPDNIELKYRVSCNGAAWKENSLDCGDIGIGQEVTFQFEFVATSCPSQSGRSDEVEISSNSITDRVIFNIEYICNCDCASNLTLNTTLCSYQGNLECGICRCENGYQGSHCQCSPSAEAVVSDSNCRASESDEEICSGNGICECGVCECKENYYGDLCQCTDQFCRSDSNGICGGPNRGTCQNCNGDQKCICEDGWSIHPNTGTCSCNDNNCRSNATDTEAPLCNGNGKCECSTCACKDIFSGNLCEICEHPRCRGLDGKCGEEAIRECATCQYDNQRQTELKTDPCAKVCKNRSLETELRVALPDCSLCNGSANTDDCRLCASFNTRIHTPVTCQSSLTTSGCLATYMIVWLDAINNFKIFIRNYDETTDKCPGPTDPLLIVLPVIGGILLLGIIALILWKIIQTLRDKNEYENFLEDTKNSQWSKGENPLFSKAAVRIENPAFVGN
ncbi:unnamed protein product [Clavelina lepadiformis]|uniref:Integrin beta n=1 Tax=Clavelina lepadiformis TaxID=159417 RepID=A0ABP0GK14_CLALP